MKIKCQITNLLKDYSAFIFRVKQLWAACSLLCMHCNYLKHWQLFSIWHCIIYQKISIFGAPFCWWLRFWMFPCSCGSSFVCLFCIWELFVLTLLELSLSCSYSFFSFGGLLPLIWKLCKIVFNTFFTCRSSTNTFSCTDITTIYKCLFQMRNSHILGGSLPY